MSIGGSASNTGYYQYSEKIDIDELYETKRQYDLQVVDTYNKMLARVHKQIKYWSKHKDVRHCWFTVPEIALGMTKYNHADCIAYIIDRLQKNGFVVQYYHPNILYISWAHYIPSYVRSEIKKKTGIAINEYGQKIATEEDSSGINTGGDSVAMGAGGGAGGADKKKREYVSTKSYKPTGNLVYADDILQRMEKRGGLS